MPNTYKNKVIYNGNTLIDLTGDDVTAAEVLSSVTKFHLPSGQIVAGTCTYDVDSSDCTAARSEILSGKTAAVGGSVITGSMTNNGSVTGTISTVAGQYTIPAGYHDGSGKVSIDSTEQSKLVANNIREGVTILGVTGTMSGEEGVNAQSKNVTPTAAGFTVTPDATYNYLSQVVVAAIPYTETDNTAGGVTVTIAAAS